MEDTLARVRLVIGNQASLSSGPVPFGDRMDCNGVEEAYNDTWDEEEEIGAVSSDSQCNFGRKFPTKKKGKGKGTGKDYRSGEGLKPSPSYQSKGYAKGKGGKGPGATLR